MGDRANIEMKSTEGSIYLYTHWNGSGLPLTLKNALSREKRWDDEAYLTRIIFCEMVKGEEQGETGYGISLQIQDNEHPLVVVDTDSQTVGIGGHTWTFGEYIESSNDQIIKLYEQEG